GRYEGSVVLAARPGAAREAIARSLPPNAASLSSAIREGKRSFEEAGGQRAYFGWPAEATADEGRATIDTLGAILAEAVAAAIGAADGAAGGAGAGA
ncbi:MAG TPA: creatininase family protein, partial [Acidobacteriota bacterium]|nr:creatininase family protein [Acidobacteriota bacterium]